MRALIGFSGALLLAACGGGGTTGTNYAEAPPVAEILATPTPRPGASATPEPEATPAIEENMAANTL